jgi:hypothetical protein
MRRLIVAVILVVFLGLGCVQSGNEVGTGLESKLPSENLPENLELVAVLTSETSPSSLDDVMPLIDGSRSVNPKKVDVVSAVEGVYSYGGAYDVVVYVVEMKSSMDATAGYLNFLNLTRFQGGLPNEIDRYTIWLADDKQITEVRDISPSHRIRFIYIWKEDNLLFIIMGNSNREQMRELALQILQT